MLSIRLTRVGRKKAPSYRVVVMPKERDPWGKALEVLGHYNPLTEPRTIELKADRIKHWISVGAEVSDSVWNLLVDAKIVDDKKRTVTHISKKRQGKMDEKSAAKKEKVAADKAAATEAKAAAKAAAETEKAEAETDSKETTPAEEPKEEKKEKAPKEEEKTTTEEKSE